MKITNLLILVLSVVSIQLSAQKSNEKKNYTGSPSNISLEQMIQTKSNDYVITKEHVSSLSGIHHIYLRQAINGLEVYGTESSVHIDQHGNVILTHNKFIDDIQRTVKSSSVGLNARQIIGSVANQMGYRISNLQQLSSEGGINQKSLYNKGGISSEDIPVKLMYYYREGVGTIKVWELSIAELTSSDWWNFRVDAATGQIIDKDNWTISCNILGDHEDHVHYNTNSSDNDFIGPLEEDLTGLNENSMMVGNYRVYAMPVETPSHGPRTLVANPEDLTASPFGWHDTNGATGSEFTNTRGNNVFAYEDGDNSGYSPDGGGGLVFDFPINTVYSNGDQSEDAAITNLFYWNNIIHDVMYHYGFDEASGNFQENNYGNGGAGSDSVNAEAQDGSGTCNANFSTPGDGSNPRMQMYVCGNRDGDLDNMVIVHEYGHGISLRLSSLGGQEQMGEGWSDYYGLMFTMESGDSAADSRGVGTWLIGQGANGAGIRPHPYSTNFGVNPHTYDDIKTEVAPHGVGSVWSMMLWEMTWELIADHGFDTDFYNGTGGNNISMALVTEALKLQTSQPGFVDGRDAILAADQALYGGANQCAIWEAFARRGLGFSADQGSSSSKTDGTEAFDLPPTFSSLDTQDEVCLADGIQTGLGGGNPTGGTYSGLGVTDDGNGTTYTFNPSVPGAGLVTISYSVNDLCTGTPIVITDDINVTDEPPTIICKGSGTIPSGGTASSSTPVSIPDNNPSGVTSTINVAESVSITDLNVNIDVSHTWVGDISVSLESPAGTTVVFFDRPGVPGSTYGCDGDDIDALLDDEAATSVENVCAAGSPTIDGSFIPNNLLSAFDGEDTAGIWILTISDHVNGDTGTLNSWGLNYSYEIVSTPLDVFLDGGGNATINAGDLIESASVACGGMTTTAGSPAGPTVSFTLADVGLNNVDVYVESDTGQITTCTAVANVIAPPPGSLTITCPANTSVECGDNTSPASTGTATASSDCDPNPVVTFSDSFSAGCGNTGVITRTWTATDTCSSPSTVTCVQTITILDTTPPSITCPPNATVECGGDTSPAATGTASGSDGCGTVGITFTDSLVASCGNTETITRTWTVTDECGNSSSCIQTITVVDTTNPTITCPANATVECGGDTSPTATGTATGSDGCGTVGITFSDSLVASCGNTETITRTWTATDECGNSSSCTQTITVVDTTPPVVSCPSNITVGNDLGSCGAIVTYSVSGSDNCGSITVSQTDGLPSGSTFPLGTTTNTFNITDECGNTTTCSFDVTVNETENPIAVCTDFTAQLDATGNVSISAADVDGGSTDNCSGVTTSVSPSNFTCADIGPNTVTLTVTDAAGNISTCTATVTIEDNMGPIAICQDLTVQLDVNGSASITPAQVDNGSTDACGIITLALDIDTFDCSDIGTNTVTLTVTDDDNNSTTCTATVTVEDNVPPEAICQDLTVQLDANGVGFITAAQVDNGSNDACGIATVNVTPNTFDCNDIGINTVTLIVTDVNGNSSNCNATITVEDNEDPVALCQDIEVMLDINGNATITGADVDNGSSDACGIISMDVLPNTFDTNDIGPNNVVLTVTDDNGNVSTCGAIVTVIEYLGVEEYDIEKGVVLYPNPARDEVILSNPHEMLLDKVDFYDLTGRLVQSEQLIGMGAEKSIDISNLASAPYLVIIQGESGNSYKQLIKE